MRKNIICPISALILLASVYASTGVYAAEEQCDEIAIIVCKASDDSAGNKQIIVHRSSFSSSMAEVPVGRDCASAIASVLKTGYCLKYVSTEISGTTTITHFIYYTLVKYKPN